MIQSAAEKFVKRQEAFGRILRKLRTITHPNSVHWIDLLLLFEEAMLMLVVLQLAWPRRRAQIFSVEQQSRRDKARGGVDGAA